MAKYALSFINPHSGSEVTEDICFALTTKQAKQRFKRNIPSLEDIFHQEVKDGWIDCNGNHHQIVKIAK
ncbi:MAG: hypothetical protein GWN01_14245 [Nitrosopumilaceae archaeon]|nr:hypothetical protein [Nitrosopumilaceae archaeon]NIU88404.1 hypothetical protein [Nitrosopumilaceae archaeon]NIV66678.1 hypothetical protein [Nitrosopumilaceae archaeon]NIX62618.1 hypothetical protein [Nitrosopumilaceae archaeon]